MKEICISYIYNFQLNHDALLYPQSLESNKPKTTEFVNHAIENGKFFVL